VRGMMLILWNVYNFFLTYAGVDHWQPTLRHPGKPEAHPGSDSGVAPLPRMTSKNVLDKWILSLLNRLTKEVTGSLDSFDTVTAISKLQKFVTEFSTWYLRRSRDRVGPTAENEEDKNVFYETTYEVLTTLCKLLGPITPFFAESIYRNLTDEESVHLTDWPKANEEVIDDRLIDSMEHVRYLVELIHSERKAQQIKLKQPLNKVDILGSDCDISAETEDIYKQLLEILKLETNIKHIEFTEPKQRDEEIVIKLDTEISDELRDEGLARDLVRKIQEERKTLGTAMDEKVSVTLPQWPASQEEYLKKHALISNLQKGSEFKVERA
jgi:isoleucyl-tRNA synthetase